MTVSIHLRGVASGNGRQAGTSLQAGQVLAHLLSVAHMRGSGEGRERGGALGGKYESGI